MSETNETPGLPFCCQFLDQHHAVQRRHQACSTGGYWWWECEHCGIGMHWDKSARHGKGAYAIIGAWIADDPPRYRAKCTVCKNE